MATRFKFTDNLRNVSYIYERNGYWLCALANGTPASFFYAVGNCDEMAIRFALEDAANDTARLNLLRRAAGPRTTVEKV